MRRLRPDEDDDNGDKRGRLADTIPTLPDSSPGITFVFPRSMFQQEAQVFQTRLIRIIKLAYQMSYTFSSSAQLAMWGIMHGEEIGNIQSWLSNPNPTNDDYNAQIDNILTNLTRDLVNLRSAVNPVINDIVVTQIPMTPGSPESSIIQNNMAHPRAKVKLAGVPFEYVNAILDDYHGQLVDYSNVRAQTLLRIGYDEMVNMVGSRLNSGVSPNQTLVDIMDRYQPFNNIPIFYPSWLIFLYVPARYYAIGFSVIADAILERYDHLVTHSAQFTLNAADLTNIQNVASVLLPAPPFGPGGLAWICIGTYDGLRSTFAGAQGLRFSTTGGVQPKRLDITVSFSNGNQVTGNFNLKPSFLINDHPSYYVAIANQFFNFVSNAFQNQTYEFYKQKNNLPANFIITSVVFTMTSLSKRARPLIGTGIDGNNIFWERLLLAPHSRFKKFLSNFVLFGSKDENGKILHGCVQRALMCSCKQNTSDAPVICSCPLPDMLESVDLESCKRMCKENGDRFMIFVIYIEKTDEHGKNKKSVELLHVGLHYYDNDDGKVLFISMPLWDRVQGHCALWLPSEYKGACRSEEFRKYLSKARYNAVLPIISGKDEPCYCPICGAVYNDKETWAHFIRHQFAFICPSCGLVFDSAESLDVHIHFHCKNLPLDSTIVLSDKMIAYNDPVDTALWICVYADLESAILPANSEGREHMNILVGWVDDYNKKVRVATEIKEFFNDLVKLPTTDIIVYFHNGEGYDFHFIVRDLCEARKGFVKEFSIVGDSGQKIRFFTVSYRGKKIHFRDSFAFVSESLEKWVESSKKSGCDFPTFKSTFNEYKREILLRKNPFPYNAILCEEDLYRTIDELWGWARCDICEELFCYKYTKEELLEFSNWLEEHCHNCGWKQVYDYYEDYLKCDVSQLKDVMDFFAQSVQQEYKINIHAYYGTPSLSWAAWLRDNKLPLEPLKESKDYDVVNSTIRGGQTGVFTRKYEQEKEGGAMFDLDCNALYATVMLKFSYPCHDWQNDDIPSDIVSWLKELHSKGRSAFIEIDMVVKENPGFFDYIPVASKRDLRGIYNYQAMQFYGTEEPSTMFFRGLTQVVGEHNHYCCHSRNLLWYLEHDVIELKKIHYILSGKDESVFKDYVSHNLEQRKRYAADPIKKMLYKLLNNSLYGKTYEDETQRRDYCLAPKETTDTEDFTKVRRTICEMGDWILYEAVKTQYNVNKPVYLGACITEFSKLWMYQFYYDRIKIHYPDSRVYYTDTDALTIFFPTKVKTLLDVAMELNTEDEQVIDTSNFEHMPEESRHIKHNNEPGLFKSETGEHGIVKFIGLRAKSYIMVCDNGDIKMSVKGCPMKEKAHLTWEDFDRVLFSKGEGYKIEFDAIRSKFHMVRSVHLEKIVLSADDRKRYILPDLIHTLPLFSKEHLEAIQE